MQFTREEDFVTKFVNWKSKHPTSKKEQKRPENHFYTGVYTPEENEYATIFNDEEEYRNNFVRYPEKYHALRPVHPDTLKLFQNRANTKHMWMQEILPPGMRTRKERANTEELMIQMCDLSKGKIVFAGGCVLGTLFMTQFSDYDIFLHSCTKEEAEKIILQIMDYLSKKYDGIFDVCRTLNAITIRVNKKKKNSDGKTFYQKVTFQIILKLYSCPSEVIHGFDIDSCCLLFDGDGYFATARGMYSLKTWTNTVNFKRLSPSYEYRLLKYALRGFAIFIPNFDINTVDRKKYLPEKKSVEKKKLILPEPPILPLPPRLNIYRLADEYPEIYLSGGKDAAAEFLNRQFNNYNGELDEYIKLKGNHQQRLQEYQQEVKEIKAKAKIDVIPEEKKDYRHLKFLIYYGCQYLNRLKKEIVTSYGGEKGKVIRYGVYNTINRYWKTFQYGKKFNWKRDDIPELEKTKKNDYNPEFIMKRGFYLSNVIDTFNISANLNKEEREYFVNLNQDPFKVKGNVKMLAVHSRQISLLGISDEIYLCLSNNFDVSQLPQKIAFKTQNPGEQMTNTFNVLVLENNELWYNL